MIQLKFALAQWIKYFLGFCKTIIKPWIKSQISYFTFQDREDQLTILWAKEYWLIFFSLLCLSWILQFNASNGTPSPSSDKLSPGQENQRWSQDINMIKIFMFGLPKAKLWGQNRGEYSEHFHLINQLFNRWGNWGTEKSDNMPRVTKLFNKKLMYSRHPYPYSIIHYSTSQMDFILKKHCL